MPTTPMIVRGTNEKPAATDALVQLIESLSVDGQLFIGYPIMGSVDGRQAVDALFVSQDHSVVVFDLVEGPELGDFEERQDEVAAKIQARLMGNSELTRRRQLLVEVTPVTFAPRASERVLDGVSDYKVANDQNFDAVIAAIAGHDHDLDLYKRVVSALQNISSIRRARTKRSTRDQHSRGGKLVSLENSIATLDNSQGKAVIETIDGVQRIRGLAGSGKTIVLALKAAYLHASHPDWKIGVTFQTRSLRPQFERLINNFSIEQTGDEPDWDNLQIIHAWGGPGGGRSDGIYHRFCVQNEIPYLDFSSARREFTYETAFQGAVSRALEEAPSPTQTFDAILIDEAQDLPSNFLRMCYEILRDPKRLVYAYDELQNLGFASMEPATKIFGSLPDGSPRVSLESTHRDHGARRDVILERCYRNSRPVLATAHALGFGIYRQPGPREDTGLVQMFGQSDLWTDIGYEVRSGALDEGQPVALARTEATSPPFLEQHSPIDDLVQFGVFATPEAQAEWIADSIAHNLRHEELRYDDIVVINPDPFTQRGNLGLIRKALYEREILSHHAGVDTRTDIFFRHDMDSVTFTGIYRAKGNEAGMVYVVNADECHRSDREIARMRNMLFTAITRSKAWVRVTGVGPAMEELAREFQAVKNADFELRFTYPTEEQREALKIVHRDMTEEEAQTVRARRQSSSDLIADLEAGRVHLEDLDKSVLVRLRRLLNDNGN